MISSKRGKESQFFLVFYQIVPMMKLDDHRSLLLGVKVPLHNNYCMTQQYLYDKERVHNRFRQIA